MNTPPIEHFVGEYRFLSNFWKAAVSYDGADYPTNENAFQAAKTDPDSRYVFRTCSPGEAKKWGREVTLVEGWDAKRLDVMYQLNREKFTRHPNLRAALLATAPAELIEGNTWNDRFWGVCGGVGQNHLGKILMRIRDELASEAT